MSGFAFEEAVATLFERLGYETEIPGRTSDLGRDVIARSADETLIVECKHTQSSVGRPVVQKLHSATVSFDTSARGVIVCTGGFSGPATEHADELGAVLELWDYRKLVRQARTVDVYFRSEARGTDLIFSPAIRERGELEVAVRDRWADGIDSAPRTARSVLKPTVTDGTWLPALRIRYRLDRRFGTSTYPNLHRARARGSLIHGIRDELAAVESDYWADASFRVRHKDPVDGQPPAALFGVDIASKAEAVKRRVARANSTSVRYTGRNNQSYTKSCIVEPEDVETDVLQVLVPRQRLDLQIGPRSGLVTVAQETGRTPEVLDADGLDAGVLRDIGRGEPAVLCNDCAALVPRAMAPRPCEDCGKTLCEAHHWDLPPAFFGSSTVLCAGCYREASQEAPLSDSPLHRSGRAALAALIPPVGLWTEGFGVGGLLSILAPLGLVGAALSVPSMPGPALYICAMLIWIIASTLLLKRASNVRTHRRNQAELEAYEPEWPAEDL
jgi:hypothetical protein